MFAVAPVMLVVGGFLGHWMGRNRRWRVFVVSMLCGMLIFALAVVRSLVLGGYDGLGVLILAALIVVPLELGGMMGAGIAMLRARGQADD